MARSVLLTWVTLILMQTNAIDTTVGIVAAQAATGIYLQQTGNLIVDNVATTSVTVNVNDVQFRSTTSLLLKLVHSPS